MNWDQDWQGRKFRPDRSQKQINILNAGVDLSEILKDLDQCSQETASEIILKRLKSLGNITKEKALVISKKLTEVLFTPIIQVSSTACHMFVSAKDTNNIWIKYFDEQGNTLINPYQKTTQFDFKEWIECIAAFNGDSLTDSTDVDWTFNLPTEGKIRVVYLDHIHFSDIYGKVKLDGSGYALTFLGQADAYEVEVADRVITNYEIKDPKIQGSVTFKHDHELLDKLSFNFIRMLVQLNKNVVLSGMDHISQFYSLFQMKGPKTIASLTSDHSSIKVNPGSFYLQCDEKRIEAINYLAADQYIIPSLEEISHKDLLEITQTTKGMWLIGTKGIEVESSKNLLEYSLKKDAYSNKGLSNQFPYWIHFDKKIGAFERISRLKEDGQLIDIMTHQIDEEGKYFVFHKDRIDERDLKGAKQKNIDLSWTDIGGGS